MGPRPPGGGPRWGRSTAQGRPYRPRVSRFWWLRRRSYLLFVLRELSSVFVAWFVVYLLLLVENVVPMWYGVPRASAAPIAASTTSW